MERTNLKVFRVQKKMTQAEFAKAVGYTRSHYAKIEKGEYDYTLKFMTNFRKYFSVSEQEFNEIMKKDEE